MKKILSLLVLLMTIVIGAKAEETVIYSWESPEGTVVETGGTVAVVAGTQEGKTDVINSASSTIAGNFHVITLQSKNDEATGYSYITLNQALQEGDQIKVSGFQNKNAGGTSGTDKKVVTFKMAFYADETKKGDLKEADDANWVNLFNDEQYADGTAPETRTYDVTATFAGSNIIRIARSKSGTNLFITKIEIVRATPTPAGPVDATFSLSKTALKVGETAKVLVDGADIYGANFNVPTSLWESAAGGPYISLSADGTVTAIKATPTGYCFYFFANSKDTEKYVSKQTTTMYLDITEDAPVTPAAAPTFKNHETKYIVDGDKICLDGTKTGAKVRLYAAANTYVRVNVAKNEMPAAPTLTSGTEINNTTGDSQKESGNIFTTDDNTATYYVRAIAWDADKNEGSANEVVFTLLPGEYSINLGTNGYSTYAGEANITITGATAYTAIVSSAKVTLEECDANAVVGAGKGIVLKGNEGDAVTIKTTAAAATVTVTGLEGVTSSTASINENPYVLSSNGTKTSFVKAGTYGTVEALMNKGYIDGNANSLSSTSLDVVFEGATAINGVAEAAEGKTVNVKVIKGGKLFIGNFNVAGQQVK